MDDHKQAVMEYVETHRDELVKLTCALVEQRSDKGQEAGAQEIVTSELESMGLDPDVWEPDVEELRDHPGYFDTSTYEEVGYEGRPNVAAVVGGSGDGRSFALSGHVDVVSADEEEWTYDPWTPTVEEDRIYGRGTCDMKGGMAANLIAARALRETGVDLAGDLVVLSTIDEEAGGTGGALSALERGYTADAALVTEPTGLPDMWIASAGVLYFRITVPGKSAHAAFGFEGVNAATKAAKIHLALDDLDRERKARIEYEPALVQRPGAEGEVTNLNVGVVEAGDWPSTLPAEATLECRIGWPPGETREEVRAEVEETVQAVVDEDEWLADHPPELEWFGWSAEPHKVDTDEEIVQLLRGHAEAITGETTRYAGGLAGLDERFHNNYYDVPTPTLGPRGGPLHGADEHVEIDSLVETAQVAALTAIDWCGVVE